MKKAILICLFTVLAAAVTAAAEPPPSNETPLADILSGLAKRYTKKGFRSDFRQTATLSGMGMTDSASGTVCFKPPGKFHWHYKQPEEQWIVSDGKALWVFRPLDNQVLVGRADEFFGDGEGASFLTDVESLTRQFHVEKAPKALDKVLGAPGRHVLKLTPKKPRAEFALVYLVIDAETFDIRESHSYNDYGDATRIRFEPPDFTADLPDAEFTFTIPKGVDVLEMEQARPQ